MEVPNSITKEDNVLNDNICSVYMADFENKSVYMKLKRVMDILLSGIAIYLLSPFFILLMIIIRATSKGPAVFRQDRIGKDGKIIEIYKFRTMIENADEILEKILEEGGELAEEYIIHKKLKNDPRVTKVGKLLRKTSIDELPQIINVLMGEMSLIGPRPYLPREIEDMGDYYNHIIKLTPGLTGYWQVSERSKATFKERLEMDMFYMDNISLLLDIKIFFKTIIKVIKKEGAV